MGCHLPGPSYKGCRACLGFCISGTGREVVRGRSSARNRGTLAGNVWLSSIGPGVYWAFSNIWRIRCRGPKVRAIANYCRAWGSIEEDSLLELAVKFLRSGKLFCLLTEGVSQIFTFPDEGLFSMFQV